MGVARSVPWDERIVALIIGFMWTGKQFLVSWKGPKSG